MSKSKEDEFRRPRAVARPAETRLPDKASQRDLAMDPVAELSAGQTHPPRPRLLACPTAITVGQAACVVLDAAHPGPEHIPRGFLNRLIPDAMEAMPVLLALVFAANWTVLLCRPFNHVRSPSTQATTNTCRRWLS